MYYKFKLVTDNLPLHLCRSQLRSHWKFNSFPGVAQNLFHLCISYNKILVGHVCSHYLNCMTSIRAVAINTVTRIVIHVFLCMGKRSVVRCWQVNIHGRPQVSQHRWLWRWVSSLLFTNLTWMEEWFKPSKSSFLSRTFVLQFDFQWLWHHKYRHVGIHLCWTG